MSDAPTHRQGVPHQATSFCSDLDTAMCGLFDDLGNRKPACSSPLGVTHDDLDAALRVLLALGDQPNQMPVVDTELSQNSQNSPLNTAEVQRTGTHRPTPNQLIPLLKITADVGDFAGCLNESSSSIVKECYRYEDSFESSYSTKPPKLTAPGSEASPRSPAKPSIRQVLRQAYLPVGDAQEARQAFCFVKHLLRAKHQGERFNEYIHPYLHPNALLTLNMPGYGVSLEDNGVEGENQGPTVTEQEFRDGILKTIADVLRRNGVEFFYIITEEKPAKGRSEFHLHILLYLPPDRYQFFIEKLHTVLAKSYPLAIVEAFKKHKRAIIAEGVTIPKGKLTAAQKYQCLRDLKHALWARKRSFQTENIRLPFYFSDDCLTKPLTELEAIYKLGYMHKGIDPNTPCMLETGRMGTLGDYSDETLRVGGRKFQRQIYRPCKRKLPVCSINIGASARAADPTFQPEEIRLEEWLIPKLALRRRAQQVAMLLAKDFHRRDEARREEESQEAAKPETTPALKLRKRSGLCSELRRLLGPPSAELRANWQIEDRDIIAEITTSRRKRELRSNRILVYA